MLAERADELTRARSVLHARNSSSALDTRVRWELEKAETYEKAASKQLLSGEMYWVSADMVSLALDAAQDVPGFSPGEDLPAASGFIVLEKPLPPLGTTVLNDKVEEVHCELPIDALSWDVVDGWMKIDSYSRGTRLVVPWTVNKFLEPVRFYKNDFTIHQDFSDPNLFRGGTELMSFLAAASLLMSSPGVTERSAFIPKTPAARKDAKKGRSTNVTVVNLRAPKTVAMGDADETGRVYTHRWMVRGHWRNQPHGPGSSRRSVRWIPSYIKGPAGKPLRKTERVWAWRR